MMRHWWIRLGWLVAAATLVVTATRLFVDEPLRAYMERELNRQVQGYSFRIEKLYFHPLGFSLDLKNLTVRQQSVPDPPVATIARWHASLEWTALLFGRLVNSHVIERPVLHITRTQVKQEAADAVPVAKRGWQEAVQSIYPFKIDEVEIVDGALTYLDEARPDRPVQLRHMNLTARNIRNVRSTEKDYPSEFQFEGELLGAGRLLVDGHADFLAEPHPGVKGAFHLRNAPLGDFLPVAGRYNIQLRQGTLSADGTVEYAPHKKRIQIVRLILEGVRVDYVHSARTQAAEARRAKEAYQTGKSLTNESDLQIYVDQAKMVNCEFGYVNEAAEPAYRIFLAQTDAELEHFSNRFTEGVSHFTLKGRFMGSGETDVTGVFRPEGDSPDFNLAVKIQQAEMRTMNDLWRAYGHFDVASGQFSFYSELDIKHGAVRGYFKPLFKDVTVYDERQDFNKGFLQRLYEGMAGDVVMLLENVARDEVATKTDISGKLNNPHTDTAEAILGLLQNAFFKAILPGLEHDLRKTG